MRTAQPAIRGRSAPSEVEQPGGGSMTTRPPARSTSATNSLDERDQHLAPSGRRTTSRSWPGRCSDLGDLADRGAVGGDHGQADQLVVVVLVRVLRRLGRVDLDDAAGCRGAPRRRSGRPRPRSAAAARPLWQRTAATVSGPAAAGSVAQHGAGANRRSGSSVRTSTVTSPRMPWARPIRPTTSCTEWSALVVVGRLGRPHGIRGELTVEVRTDEPDLRLAAGSVLATDPAAAGPLTVTAARWHSGRLLLAFAGVADRTGAEALRGVLLQADIDPARVPEDPAEFYDHQLVGLPVVLADGTAVGELARGRAPARPGPAGGPPTGPRGGAGAVRRRPRPDRRPGGWPDRHRPARWTARPDRSTGEA